MPDSWGGFMNKPARGWLHPDNVITRSSVCYEVRVCSHNCFLLSVMVKQNDVYIGTLTLIFILVYWMFGSTNVYEKFGL